MFVGVNEGDCFRLLIKSENTKVKVLSSEAKASMFKTVLCSAQLV